MGRREPQRKGTGEGGGEEKVINNKKYRLVPDSSALCHQSCLPEFNPMDPWSGRREPIREG